VHDSGVISDTSSGPIGGDGLSTTSTRQEAVSLPTQFTRWILPESIRFELSFLKIASVSLIGSSMRSFRDTSLPFTIQIAFGRGVAVYGTMILNGSRAITRMSRMPMSDVIFGAVNAALTMIGSDGLLYGLVPAALTAATRNTYSWFSDRPVTLHIRSLSVPCCTFDQWPSDASFFSTM
uniref:Uncharacterized protein n=1 Tax=Anopheles albimanus TaxID=7167 RepID=A0A182FQ28_ANOAL